jgi:AcrR family transcriptional regulator
MGLRETKMERTRQFIADTAFELFVTHGYDNTTLEQIAAAAEVGARTLYRYYPTKEALVVNFVEEGLTTALAVFGAQPDDVPLPQALYAMIDSVQHTITTNPSRLVALYRMTNTTAALRARLAEQNWRWREDLAREIMRRMGGPEFDLVATLTAGNTMNIIEVIVRKWVDSDGTANVADLARQTLHLLRANAIPVPTPA